MPEKALSKKVFVLLSKTERLQYHATTAHRTTHVRSRMKQPSSRSIALVRFFAPNVTALGYALFLAINAASVWGGVFPFLPLKFQTPEIVFWFFLGQSLSFSLSFFASAVGVYYLPEPTRRFMVKLAAAPYMVGWCLLISAMYLHAYALPLTFCGGVFLGLGSAGFYMLWQRLFASREPDRGTRELMLGTAYGALLYFGLHLIPIAVTAYLIPFIFLPLFGLAIVLQSRTLDVNQPMFEDTPREHPHVYRRVMKDVWRSGLCVGCIGFCAGIMRSLAIAEPTIGSLVNILSMAAALVAALALLVLWRFKNLRMNIVRMYRVFFPFAISGFLVLPFLPTGYQRWFAAALYAAYSVSIMLMMMQSAQVSRDRGVNPIFVYGIMGGIVYVLHNIGFTGGTLAADVSLANIPSLACVALLAVYLLGLMHFIGHGGMRSALGHEAENIELTALPLPSDSEHAEKPGQEERPAAQGQEEASAERPHVHAAQEPREKHDASVIFLDRISKQAECLRQQFRLTSRETEVAEYIARGYTVARIAEELVVSENTIRTHSKRIYTKTDVHKRQELMDLMASFDLRALG